MNRYLYAFVTTFLCSTTLVVAAPTVTGTTISWPDDGWYQVQNAEDYSTLCEGGTNCDVDPGSYVVINHTTGERFPDIVIEVTHGETSVLVTGSTISWPDDGWYQVQTNSDYSTVCEGGLSCEVSPGNYVVINHTTGERFPDIVVESTTNDIDIVVAGNTISWPDDGWYQVQTTSNYSTVCEGGLSCEVAPGNYVVINHTTGERFPDIAVESTQVESDIQVTGYTISWPDNGWYQVQSANDYSTICEGGNSCEVAPGRYNLINLTTAEIFRNIYVNDPGLEFPFNDLITSLAGYQSEELSTKVQRISGNIEALGLDPVVIIDNLIESAELISTTNKISYACSAGGQMIREQIVSITLQSSLSRTDVSHSYTFEQCLMTVTDASLPTGDYRLDGTFSESSFDISSRETSRGTTRSWNSFVISEPTGNTVVIDGSTIVGQVNSGDTRNTRNVVINRYEQTQSEQLIISMIDVLLSLTTYTSGSNYSNHYELNASGQIRGAMTNGNMVTLSTDPIFNHRTTALPESDPPTFTGGMQMISDSGSHLTISAEQRAAPRKLVSYTYWSVNGDTFTAGENEFVNLDIRPRN